LTFAPTSPEGGYHEIEVRVLTGPNLKVSARTGYWIAPRGPSEPAKK
jgi:hypothetical protein